MDRYYYVDVCSGEGASTTNPRCLSSLPSRFWQAPLSNGLMLFSGKWSGYIYPYAVQGPTPIGSLFSGFVGFPSRCDLAKQAYYIVPYVGRLVDW
jgi:hypothetical protein